MDRPPGEEPPVAVTGHRRGRPVTRRRRIPRARWFVLVVFVGVVVWAAVVGLALVRADSQLQAATARTDRLRHELTTTTLTDGAVGTDLATAAAEFRRAHAEVSGAWFAPLGVIPVVGTQIHAVQDLSGAAAQVLTAGSSTLDTVRALLAQPRRLPAQRTAIVTRLAAAIAGLDRRVAGVGLGPTRGLVGPLAAKHDTFAADLTRLRTGLTKATAATAALADLLQGPRTYLLAATNNAEMRAGSGMMLEAGTLTVDDGRFSLGRFAPTSTLSVPSSAVAPSGDLARLWGFEHPADDFRTLLLSPQLPPNAALAAQMWRARTGQRVDGVITVDVVALQDLLGVTGPVTVDGTVYTQADVVGQLLYKQYQGLASDGAANDARHERLGLLAAAVFRTLQNGGLSLTHLASALDQAVNGRHLLVWAAAPTIEADWTTAGAGGAVTGDDVLVSLLNLGANKLDPYQVVDADLSTVRQGSTTAVTVTVHVANTTPVGVSGYAAGGGPGLPPPRQYTGAVALELPATAGRVTAAGGPILAAGHDGPADEIAVQIGVPDGTAHTVTFHFVLAGTGPPLEVVASARFPATTWTVSTDGRPAGTFTDTISHLVPG